MALDTRTLLSSTAPSAQVFAVSGLPGPFITIPSTEEAGLTASQIIDRTAPEDGPLLDPCCGAGTIVIEAAQIACGIAPGLQRRFAFEGLQPFRSLQAAWRDLQRDARARVHASPVPIFAGDVS